MERPRHIQDRRAAVDNITGATRRPDRLRAGCDGKARELLASVARGAVDVGAMEIGARVPDG